MHHPAAPAVARLRAGLLHQLLLGQGGIEGLPVVHAVPVALGTCRQGQ